MISVFPYIHPSCVIDLGAEIGSGTKVWHFCHVSSKVKIGIDCILGQNVFIADNVILGNHVKVQNNVSIYSGVVCEDEVFLGPSMVFTNIINPRAAISRKDQFLPTLVKKGASVGANATILCGLTLGEYCLIAAGSVVTRDVQPYSLVMGNPARHTGWVSAYGQRLHFNANGEASCPESGQTYTLANQVVRPISKI